MAEAGRTLGYLYDPLGPSGLRDSTHPTAPGTRAGVLHNAAGQVTQMVVYQPNGTSETETFTYNVLGQLTQASGRGSNIEYRYSATANDGRITSRKDNVSGEEVSYQYDQLGRLIAASTTGPEWGLAWVYDGFGNRLQQNVTKGTGPSAVYNVDPTTNRMTGAGITYDPNGNMTGLGTGSGTATYDYFNRMVTVTTGNGTEWCGYSAANQRIQASRANGTFETFFYGVGGELLGVYQRGTKANGHYYFSSASIRVRFAGRLIDGGGSSLVTDRLGSVVKNGTETLSYYPYGEQRSGNANADREKFATYTRDAVSGLDYAWNRYYSSESGRFAVADHGPVSRELPSSWNRYTYGWNDPINTIDNDGRLPLWIYPPRLITDPVALEEWTNEFAAERTTMRLRQIASEYAIQKMHVDCEHAIQGLGYSKTDLNAANAGTRYYNIEGDEGALSIWSAAGTTYYVTLPSGAEHQIFYLSEIFMDVDFGRDRPVAFQFPGQTKKAIFVTSAFFGPGGVYNQSLVELIGQGQTLLHELMHLVTGLGDVLLAQAFHLQGSKSYTPGKQGDENSASFDLRQWFQGGCDPSFAREN